MATAEDGIGIIAGSGTTSMTMIGENAIATATETVKGTGIGIGTGTVIAAAGITRRRMTMMMARRGRRLSSIMAIRGTVTIGRTGLGSELVSR
jgi:hypothetical protein